MTSIIYFLIVQFFFRMTDLINLTVKQSDMNGDVIWLRNQLDFYQIYPGWLKNSYMFGWCNSYMNVSYISKHICFLIYI